MSLRGKVLVVFLAAAAALSLVAAAIWLSTGKVSRQSDPAGKPPVVTFAKEARTGNAALDTFVHDFVALCVRGDYDSFRLCWTAYGPPISGSRFRKMWDAAEHVEITRIDLVPGKKGQAYLVQASVQLSPSARVQQRDVEVLVIWEDGKWVIAPAPSPPPEQLDLPSLPVSDSQPTDQG